MTGPAVKLSPLPKPTRDELRDRLREAARTLRSVKLTSRDIPQSIRSAWPEIVRKAADQFAAEVGATESEVKDMHAPRLRVRLCPSAAEISRMDEALSWLEWIHGDERRIVFARALRIPYGVLALNFHCSARKILDIEIRGLDKISEKMFA